MSFFFKIYTASLKVKLLLTIYIIEIPIKTKQTTICKG